MATKGRFAKYALPYTTRELKPAMGFDEIGRELGIGRKAAYAIFVRGMKKLIRRPRTMQQYRELVEYRRKIRETRTRGTVQTED